MKYLKYKLGMRSLSDPRHPLRSAARWVLGVLVLSVIVVACIRTVSAEQDRELAISHNEFLTKALGEAEMEKLQAKQDREAVINDANEVCAK